MLGRARRRRRGRAARRAGLGSGGRLRRRPADRVRASCYAALDRRPRSGSRRSSRQRGARSAGPTDDPGLAGDHPAHPQGLDRPRRRRRRAGRGHLPRSPGAAGGGPGEPGPPAAARGVAAHLPARTSCSIATGGWCAELRRAGARRRQADVGLARTRTVAGCSSRCRRPSSPIYALTVDDPGQLSHENTRAARRDAARPLPGDHPADDGGGRFRLFCPDETASNRLQAVFEVTDRCLHRARPRNRRPPRRPTDG